jgi:aminobenzoyl-glutamate transport protein
MAEEHTTPAPAPPPAKMGGILGWIEWAGNKLPDPAMLFVWALVITWVLSAWLSTKTFSEIDPRSGTKDVEIATPLLLKNPKGDPIRLRREHLALLAVVVQSPYPGTLPWQTAFVSFHKESKKTIQVKNMLTPTALVEFLTSMVKTFTGFHPLGVVLVALLGVGVAEHTGFINAFIKAMLSFTPKFLITPMLIAVGIISHTAGDTGYVLVIPLGGIIFYAAGRHPLAGIACAFAAVSGGFSANFVPSGLDPLLQGLTQQSAQVLDPTRTVNPLCNYTFTFCSGFLIIGLGWFITDVILEPRLRRSTPVDGDPADMPTMDPLTPRETWALFAGLGSMGLCLGLLALACLPADSPFRSKSGELATQAAPLMDAIVPLIFLAFLVPGIVYGYAAGTVKSHRDIVKGMSKSMSTMGYYLVLAFFASLFIKVFGDSNLGALVAVKGAGFLQSLQVSGPVTILGIILLSATVNLLIGSASAKWALLGPIFVPMLMTLGFSPELTQAAYRVGDSSTNIITPLMPYFSLVVAFAQRYVKNTGIGTMIAMMIAYSFTFLIVWSGFLIFFWKVLGLNLGFGGVYTYP